jgi:hypothetical protein
VYIKRFGALSSAVQLMACGWYQHWQGVSGVFKPMWLIPRLACVVAGTPDFAAMTRMFSEDVMVMAHLNHMERVRAACRQVRSLPTGSRVALALRKSGCVPLTLPAPLPVCPLQASERSGVSVTAATGVFDLKVRGMLSPSLETHPGCGRVRVGCPGSCLMCIVCVCVVCMCVVCVCVWSVCGMCGMCVCVCVRPRGSSAACAVGCRGFACPAATCWACSR